MKAKGKRTGLTKEQIENIRRFLLLFSDVESALKERLGLNGDNPTGIRRLINTYEERNPYWMEAANQLRHFAQIRNFLVHEASSEFGYPVGVTLGSIRTLREIKEDLVRPEPVSARFAGDVITVSPSESLAHVLSLAFKHDFSQFPVVSEGKFQGLITENEIIRWLGHRSQRGLTQVQLKENSVRGVLKEKGPGKKGIPIFVFKPMGAAADEIMSLFSIKPTLEVVLLTKSGRKSAAIRGIITQWDAARYTHTRSRPRT